MLAATRETILEELLNLSRLVNAYQHHEPDFAIQANSWLLQLENTLQKLRSPLAASVSSQRGRISSATEGYGEPNLQQSRMSRRKRIGVTTALALAEIEKVLSAHVQSIDDKFDVWREKLAQFVSVASVSHPIPLPPTEPRQTWLKEVWRGWSSVVETRAMYHYLSAVMTPSDRLYLLNEILDNLLTPT